MLCSRSPARLQAPISSQIIPVYDAKVQARARYHAFYKKEGEMKEACMQFKKEAEQPSKSPDIIESEKEKSQLHYPSFVVDAGIGFRFECYVFLTLAGRT
jgi:hypothetical protein